MTPYCKDMLWHKIYVLHPSKPWVVLIHGAGGSSTIWHPQLRVFKRHFNVLMLDLRGHGKSINAKLEPVQSYSFKLIVEDIDKILNHQQIKKAHFIGVSLGTLLIREYIHEYPEKVLSVTYTGAITKLDFRSRFLVSVGHTFKQIIPFLSLYKLFAWIIMPGKAHLAARQLFIQQAGQIAQDEFLRWFELTRSVDDVISKFDQIEPPIPSLFVMGDKDHLFLGQVRLNVRKNPEAELIVLDNCGHVCNIEKPEAFNQHVQSFIMRIHQSVYQVQG